MSKTWRELAGMACENCTFFDAENQRCKAPDNPDPDQQTYPSDSCEGFERRSVRHGQAVVRIPP